MYRIKFIVVSLVLFLQFSSYADFFSAINDEPTIYTSNNLQEFVNTISQYEVETPENNAFLQKIVDYYKKVHILNSIQKNDYVVDCIPFAEQPALIDFPKLAESLIDEVKESFSQNFSELVSVGNNFEVNSSLECPYGSVAIIRPTKMLLTSKYTNKKDFYFMNSDPNILFNSSGSGYTWEQGVNANNQLIQIKTQKAEAFFRGPQLQSVTPSSRADHSIAQFWLLNRGSEGTYSVEFGLIASSYFTSSPSTSIFIFASVDNYGSRSCYNMYCSNFIQMPGTPAFGVPLKNKNNDFIFQVDHLDKNNAQSGYYLTLVSGDSSAQMTTLAMGYYPDRVYPSTNVLPNAFSVGAEVYANSPNNGTTMYGNYVNPYPEYQGEKQINIFTQNGNYFPFYSSTEVFPYNMIWHFGQKK